MMKNKFSMALVIIAISIIGISLFLIFNRNKSQTPKETLNTIKLTLVGPTPYQFPYKIPNIPKDRSYRTVIVGDSIVASLGANANILREKLIEYYPDNEFVTYNYGYGSTNIESLNDRLTKETTYLGEKNPPILTQGIELIIIESFGFNPLSEYALETGLEKQTQVLEENIKLILEKKPNTVLVFMTPIAPSMTNFARGTIDLSQEQRTQWVTERIAYIENHKRFAESKGISVIDVYAASLNDEGEVNLDYVSNDFIHPSDEGIELISQEIADFIFENSIFPR